MTTKTINKFISALENEIKAHSCYLWGGQGQSVRGATVGFIVDCETSANNANRVLKHIADITLKGHLTRDTKFFDCSGLITHHLMLLNVLKGDTTADGLMKMCSNVSRETLKRGDLVFVFNGSKATHVGVYVGDNMVIESKGRDYGVVKTAITTGSWNRFGRLTV